MMPRLRVFSRRQLACQQAVELVTDYLEGSLSATARRRFEKHLAGCPHCTEYLVQIRATLQLTGRIDAGDMSPQMLADFLELYREWRAEDGAE